MNKEKILEFIKLAELKEEDLLIIDEFAPKETLEFLKEELGKSTHVGTFYHFRNDKIRVTYIAGRITDLNARGLGPKYVVANIHHFNFKYLAPILQRYKDSEYEVNLVRKINK